MPKANIFVYVSKDFLESGVAADLAPIGSMILLAIAAHANQYGEESFPSQKRIARLIGVSEDTVNRHLQKLLDYTIDGRPLITVRHERSGNGHRRNNYTVTSASPVGQYRDRRVKRD